MKVNPVLSLIFQEQAKLQSKEFEESGSLNPILFKTQISCMAGTRKILLFEGTIDRSGNV
jgi:hypothetical protein